MLCCIRRTKPVEKAEEADQEIKQDGVARPEEKAHKAATKIQASFRGHITRKKMKDDDGEATPTKNPTENPAENQGENGAAEPPATEEQGPASKVEEQEERAQSPIQNPAEPENPAKPENPENKENPKEAGEKPSENVEPEKKEEEVEEEEKVEEVEEEEPKQAHVPAAASEAGAEQTQGAADPSEPVEGAVSEPSQAEEKTASA